MSTVYPIAWSPDPAFIPPPAITFEMQGVRTQPSRDPPKWAYLVLIASRGEWWPVEVAMRSGLVQSPQGISSDTSTPDTNRRESDIRVQQLIRQRNSHD